MSVVRATEVDLDNLHRLLRAARFKFADFGPEDLPRLLSDSISMLGRTDGTIWGFISLQPEERPVTLPTGAPTRCYFRALALRSGYAPTEHVNILLENSLRRLDDRGEPMQIIAYGGEGWIANALHNAGFAMADQVQFYELHRPHRQVNQLPAKTNAATLRLAESANLGQLAEMDASAFPPLWHFGHTDMFELLLRSRMTIAMLGDESGKGGEIAGYTAAVSNSSEDLQLARLAVRSDLQGLGIGRQLLRDVVTHAATERYERIILNTQTDNERSQKLYRAYGFRPVGRPVPVLTKLIGVVAGESHPAEL